MSYNCSLSQWETNSRVIHAVSDTPDGPYIRDNIAVPIWAHNPTIHKVPNKTEYIVYHIGQGTDHGTPINCSANMTNIHKDTHFISDKDNMPDHPNYIEFTDLNGPYTEVNSKQGDWSYNNPAAYFYPNGSVLLIYKIACPNINSTEFCREFAVAMGESYKGPFKFIKNTGVYGEDAYIWRDLNGYFHMLFQGGNYDPSLPYYIGHFHTAFSLNGIDWTVGNHSQAYNNTISLQNGTTIQVYRRERCQLLFDYNTGLPSYLFNGAGNNNFSYTSVQPINIE